MAEGNGSNGNGVVNGNGKKVLGPSTLLPLGMVAAMVVSVITAERYLDAKFNTMAGEIQDVKQQVNSFKIDMNYQLQTIRATVGNRWTSQDMKVWEQSLKIKNPTLDVPDCNEIVKTRTFPDSVAR
jgi:hypothetical protein